MSLPAVMRGENQMAQSIVLIKPDFGHFCPERAIDRVGAARYICTAFVMHLRRYNELR